MSVEIVPNIPQLTKFKSHQHLLKDYLRTQKVSLSYYELVEDKLSRRTKEDLNKLNIYISKIDLNEFKQISDSSDKPDSLARQNLYLDSFNFPCFFNTCGHVFDFIQILDKYTKCQKWICPRCKGCQTNLKNVKVFKKSDVDFPLKSKITHSNPKVKRDKSKSEKTSLNKIEQRNIDMILEDIEQRIGQLSIMDTTSMDSQNSNILNFKIENLLGEVSLNSKQEKATYNNSPASIKAQEIRSETTLSTNSSSNKNGQNYHKMLRFTNESQNSSMPSQNLLVPNGVSKSEIKRNWKLQNGGSSNSSNNTQQQQTEFKIPSPKNKYQICERNRSKRNRSLFRMVINGIKDEIEVASNNADQVNQQTNLKKRTNSANKKQDQADVYQRINRQRPYEEEQGSLGFHLNTYKRQRFA